MNMTVLHCSVLYSSVLYCTVLYCTVLYCTVLYCIVLILKLNETQLLWSQYERWGSALLWQACKMDTRTLTSTYMAIIFISHIILLMIRIFIRSVIFPSIKSSFFSFSYSMLCYAMLCYAMLSYYYQLVWMLSLL